MDQRRDNRVWQQPRRTDFRVPAQGGEVVAATRVGAPQQRGHMFPSFLPDGRHFVFYAIGSPEAQGVYLGSWTHWSPPG